MIWRFTLILIKINYGQIEDQTGLFYTTNPVFYTGQSVRQSVRWKPNVFPDRIEFYRICPLDRHVWESLGTFYITKENKKVSNNKSVKNMHVLSGFFILIL